MEEILEKLERMNETAAFSGKARGSPSSPRVSDRETPYAVSPPASPSNPSSSPAGPKVRPEEDVFPKEAFLEFVRTRYLPLAAYLSHGVPRWADEHTLEWDFRKEPFQLRLLEANSNQKKLEGLVREYFRKEIRLVFVGEKTEGVAENNPTASTYGRNKRPSRAEALSHPQVKDLIEVFQAEVAEIRLPTENT